MANRPDDDPPPPEVTVSNHASGDGAVYSVVKGTMHIYPATANSQPLELPAMRVWLEHLRQELSTHPESHVRSRHGDRLHEVEAAVNDFASGPRDQDGMDFLRRVMASGVVSYLGRAKAFTKAPTSEIIVVDVMVSALWPLVQMPRLPRTWQSELGDLTSSRVAHVVAEARRTRATVDWFMRSLTEDGLFVSGLMTLLDDLNNPRRGGGALAALALAGGLLKPPRRGGYKATLKWIFLGATGGAAAAKIDELLYHIGTSGTGLHTDVNQMPQSRRNPPPGLYPFLDHLGE